MTTKRASANNLKQRNGSKKSLKIAQTVTILVYLQAIVTKIKSSTIFSQFQKQRKVLVFRTHLYRLNHASLNKEKASKPLFVTKGKTQKSKSLRQLLT